VAEFQYHAGEKVLEVGVGIGTDLVQYAKNGSVVSGLDLTDNAVAVTRRNLELRSLPYKFLGTGDAERLPFADNEFDLVYSFGVLHHTPNPDQALSEIHRVLRPGGKAIVMLYARGWKHYLKRVLLHGVLLGKFRRFGYSRTISMQTEVHGDSPLTYVLTWRQVRDLFGRFGEVEITKYRMGEYFDYAPYGTRKVPAAVENLVNFLSLERILGENYVVKAVKTEAKPRYPFWRTLLQP